MTRYGGYGPPPPSYVVFIVTVAFVLGIIVFALVEAL